jgi:hypothetical protein
MSNAQESLHHIMICIVTLKKMKLVFNAREHQKKILQKSYHLLCLSQANSTTCIQACLIDTITNFKSVQYIQDTE